MKRTYQLVLGILIALLLLITVGCNQNDISLLHDQDDHILIGQWNLINVSCECAPSDLKVGEHIWSFDLAKSVLLVQNSVDKPLQILETGSYDFELTDSTVSINSVTYDYFIEKGHLFLADHPEVDGPLMKFVR